MRSCGSSVLCVAAVGALTIALLPNQVVSGHEHPYLSRQTIAPVYEAWDRNKNGSFNLVFGYFNRNRDEIVDVPVGPENNIEPGGPDRGQPTRLYPLRNRYWFKVAVPHDFSQKELVWTLTVHGKTERAYASLRPE